MCVELMRKISLYIEKDFCPAHDIKPSGTILQILFKMEVSSMRMKQRKGGYSANTAKNYIDLSAPTRCLSVELDEQVKMKTYLMKRIKYILKKLI